MRCLSHPLPLTALLSAVDSVASRCPALSLLPSHCPSLTVASTASLSSWPVSLTASRCPSLCRCLPLPVTLHVSQSLSHCSPLTLSLPISCCRSIHCRVATFTVSCCMVGRPSQHGTKQARSPCQGRSCCTTALLPDCGSCAAATHSAVGVGSVT